MNHAKRSGNLIRCDEYGMSYASELNAWSVGFEAAGVSSHIGFAIRVICSLRLETIGAVN